MRDRDTTKLNNVPGRTRMAGLKTNDYEMRNKRDVWFISSKPFAGAHFAVMPEALVEPCILAGSKEGDTMIHLAGRERLVWWHLPTTESI